MHTKKHVIPKLLTLIGLAVFLLLNSNIIASSARTAIIDFCSIPLKAIGSIGNAAKRIVPFASLREDNRRLNRQVDFLSRRITEMSGLRYENERLKALLDFKNAIPYKVTPAQVIGRDPTNWSNSIIIDKGRSKGITGDRAVLSTRGLVGRILEAGRYSAKILLITDPNSKVGVVIQRNAQGGMLIGRPDGQCKMVYIALDSDVAKGDKVITAGYGGVFPKNILVGEVVSVDKEPGRLYKYAIVKTSEDMSKLEEVMCIK